MRTFPAALALTVAALVGSTTAVANTAADARGFSLSGGIGFAAGPTGFLIQLEAPYAFNDTFSLGPQFQLGVGDGKLVVAPALSGRVGTNLSFINQKQIARTRIFAQLGIGMAYVSIDQKGGRRDGIAFLLNPGFGAEYPLTDHLSFTSSMLFNALPGEAAGEGFFFSWQMLGLRYSF